MEHLAPTTLQTDSFHTDSTTWTAFRTPSTTGGHLHTFDRGSVTATFKSTFTLVSGKSAPTHVDKQDLLFSLLVHGQRRVNRSLCANAELPRHYPATLSLPSLGRAAAR